MIYHVQYFGKQAQHGWTSPGLIFPFKGELEFYARRRELKERATCVSVKKKIESKYSIAPGVLEAWVIAVREAESVMEYETQDRYVSCVFKYDDDFEKSGSNQGAFKRTKSEGESNHPKKAKVQAIYGSHQRLCRICDKGNVNLVCRGFCMQYFHKECLGLINTPKCFRCIYCEQGPFINCVQCGAAFRANLNFMPVGSVKLTSTTMLCPEHLLGGRKISPQPCMNVSYCSLCAGDGDLIACETCPNSFHVDCLDTTEVPTGGFICSECVDRKYLYVGMVVWAMTGKFKWWPAQIMDENNLPQNVKNMVRYDGEFPIQYFAVDDYFWTHRGRVIPYAAHHEDYCRTVGKQCKLDYKFILSVEEASSSFDEYIFRRKMPLLEGEQYAYRHIRTNRAVAPAKIDSSTGKSVLPCSCNSCKPFPCGADSGCLNRSMLMECHPDVCLGGDRCENQRFHRRKYAAVKVFKTKNRGWGLQSDQFIPKGSLVIEYVGEVITHEEYKSRLIKMQSKNEENFYFLYLDSHRMIDARHQGNSARFMNHSCNGNCELSRWSSNGDLRIGIFAIRDIHDGEELTYNYQFYGIQQFEYDKIQREQKCNCGSAICQGFIGRSGKKSEK